MMTVISAPRPRESRGTSAWLVAVCALLSLAPFIIAPLPGMPDLYNHMARFYVLYHGTASAFLGHYYAVHWSLIGNLGMDLLVFPFDRLLGPERGAITAAALIAPLTILGLAALSRAVRGSVTPAIFLALPFVFSYAFLYGFINYHLSIALAFLGAASWIATRSRSPLSRLSVHAIVAAMIWLAHAGGWLVFLVLAGSSELVTVRQSGAPATRAVTRTAWRCLPLCLPLLAMVIWRAGTGSGIDWSFDPALKVRWLGIFLASESRLFDIACAVALEGAAFWLLRHERAGADRGLLLAAATLGLLFAALPQRVFGSFYADERLLAVAFMVFFLSFAPEARTTRMLVGVGGFCLFAVRLALITAGWYSRGTSAMADLAVLNSVPAGSRIAVRARANVSDPWPLSVLDELPSLAIIRRQAFVDTQWDMPGGQIMRPVYNRGRGFNDCSSVYGWTEDYPDGQTAAEFLAKLPRDRFDYVWDFMQPGLSAAWLQPIGAGPNGQLYRVLHTS